MNKPAKQTDLDPNSDEAIGAMLDNHPGLNNTIRGELDAVVTKLGAFWWVNHRYVKFRCDRFSDQLRATAANWRATGCPPTGPERKRVEIEQYRIYRDALAWVNGLHKVYAEGPAGSRQLNAQFDSEMERHFALVVMPDPPPPTPFDARGFVTMLAQRGVVMVVDGEGGMSAMPSTKLTDQDRAIIREHRSAIAEAVSALTEAF